MAKQIDTATRETIQRGDDLLSERARIGSLIESTEVELRAAEIEVQQAKAKMGAAEVDALLGGKTPQPGGSKHLDMARGRFDILEARRDALTARLTRNGQQIAEFSQELGQAKDRVIRTAIANHWARCQPVVQQFLALMQEGYLIASALRIPFMQEGLDRVVIQSSANEEIVRHGVTQDGELSNPQGWTAEQREEHRVLSELGDQFASFSSAAQQIGESEMAALRQQEDRAALHRAGYLGGSSALREYDQPVTSSGEPFRPGGPLTVQTR